MNRRGAIVAGLASIAGLASGKLVLAGSARPTPPSGDPGEFTDYMERNGLLVRTAQMSAPAAPAVKLPASVQPTQPNLEGPFYRPGAPTRYAITSPYEPGTVMVIRGRVWAYDTKLPIAGAILHVWQADEKGRYDNDTDPAHPPAEFVNRGILHTDASGAYEYQTIHPGRYLDGAQYRPAHIHYMIFAPGYRTLTTQLYFDGDPYNKTDRFIRQSLIIPLATERRYGKDFEKGTFDIVLRPV